VRQNGRKLEPLRGIFRLLWLSPLAAKTSKTGQKREETGGKSTKSADFCGNRRFRLDFAHQKVAL
jgi:hypothetical protein